MRIFKNANGVIFTVRRFSTLIFVLDGGSKHQITEKLCVRKFIKMMYYLQMKSFFIITLTSFSHKCEEIAHSQEHLFDSIAAVVFTFEITSIMA
jgi:hypothetical protein